ncbi:MAG: DUF502 domain-containing protein [Chlamydiales bacterium]|nr:DUF502 domain-containing protein [Chlamydiales bacterium]
MKKYFLTGLIIFLPLAITIFIPVFLFQLLTSPFLGLLEYILTELHVNPAHYDLILLLSKFIFLIILFIVIVILGFIGHHVLSHWFVHWMDRLFLRIPVIKTIYRLSAEVVKSFFQTTEKPFKKTVLLRFPNMISTVYGFVTGDAPQQIKKFEKSDENLKAIFIPTAPHPISGFLVMVQEKLIQDVDISIEDVFKSLLSCGLYVPGENQKKPNEPKK